MSRLTDIAILDDDPLALAAMAHCLEGYRLHPFRSVRAAESWLHADRARQLILLDLNLGTDDGLEVLRKWKTELPDVDIIVCSGETRVERAIDCLRAGAADYIVKPYRSETVRFIVGRVLEQRELRRKTERLNPLLKPHPCQFIGESTAARHLLEKVEALRGQTQLNVLILGESGTGKEVIARLLHQQESTEERPFVATNMSAIPTSLLEAELFGVERGAYTDAKVSRAGRFEMADGGDIFLDEVGDLPLETQSKLLRTLQEKRVDRVGSTHSRLIEFRVISATNQPLAQLIAEGRFREDLVYRMSDLVLWVPPLRERMEDLPLLVEHLLRKHSPRGGAPRVSEHAIATLMGYSWPGNVRQLESTLKRALVFNQGGLLEKIEIYDWQTLLPRHDALSPPTETQASWRAREEKRRIEQILAKHQGNRTAALRELGISRATFYRKLQGEESSRSPSQQRQ